MPTQHANGSRSASATLEGMGTPRTIEEIERRAQEIDAAELDAMHRIAEQLRDLAVELPVESKLPVSLAKTANSIDEFTGLELPASWPIRDLNRLVEDVGRERVLDFIAEVEAYVDRVRRSVGQGMR